MGRRAGNALPDFPRRKHPANEPLPYDRGYGGSMNQIAYCAEEVRRQRDTPWHVFKMIQAFRYAQNMIWSSSKTISMVNVLVIGAYIDEANVNGFRKHGVRVGGRDGADWQEIPRLIEQLLEAQGRLTPEEFYLEFEQIHPFADGNGRTGKILYNWLKGTLSDPVWPPDFFGGIENP